MILMCRETTALQRKLEAMAQQIGNFGLAAAIFTLAAMAGQFTWHTFFVDGQAWDNKYLTDYLSYVITSITIVVGYQAPCNTDAHLNLLHAQGSDDNWQPLASLAVLYRVLEHPVKPMVQGSRAT